MNRAATLTLSLLALASTAGAKDLQGVFEDALHNDPVIKQANANRLATREARPQAWAAVLPQFNGTAGVTRDHTSGFQGQVAEVGNPNNPTAPPSLVVVQLPETIDTTTKTWALNLRSNLFSWTNWMQIKAASKEVAQAEATYEAAEQDLILRVATAYFVVLAADDTLLANQAALEAISRQLDQANKRFEVGLIAITDVQEARSAHDTAAATVIAAKRALATDIYRLQEITGQQYDRLSKPDPQMPLAGPDPLDASRWVDISLAQNPTLVASRLGADVARENVRSAIGGHLPTLDLVAGRSYTEGNSDQVLAGRVLQRRQQQVQRPADRAAAHGADLQWRLHPVEGARERVPLAGGQGSGGRQFARHGARRARLLSRRHQRHRPRAGAAPGAGIGGDRVARHRGGLRGGYPHRSRRAQRAPHAGAGAERLRRQPL